MKNVQLKTIGINLLRWTALGLLIGVICGALGAIFSKAIALIGAELFRGQGIGYLALAAGLGYLLTHWISLYTYPIKK